MPKGFGSTLLKLLAASLIVGLIMSWFDITPRSLIANFGDTVVRIFGQAVSFLDWAVGYVLVGAIIVVPIWLLVVLLDRAKRNKGS